MSINQSIMSICRHPLSRRSQGCLQRIGARKQVSLESSCELFSADVFGSELNGKIVPDGRSGDAETAGSIASSPGPRLNQIPAVSRPKSGARIDGRHWAADVPEVGRTRATDAVERHHCDFVVDALCHGQPVQRVAKRHVSRCLCSTPYLRL